MPIAQRTMLICTNPRSGSQWLAELIRSTAILGNPQEYFHPKKRRSLSRGDIGTMVASMLAEGVTDNGIAAAKIMAYHFLKVSRAARLPELLPDLRYVHLYRRDLLGQTISHFRAGQTGGWNAWLKADRVPHYDGRALLKKLHGVTQNHAAWLFYFARTGVPFFDIAYEDLVSDPHATITALCRFMGVTPPSAPLKWERAVIQRDRINDEWRTRFLAEFGDRARFTISH
jgi:LPS sulfotransferase NodH